MNWDVDEFGFFVFIEILSSQHFTELPQALDTALMNPHPSSLSPESVPSLAELSSASRDEPYCDHDNLFGSGEEDEITRVLLLSESLVLDTGEQPSSSEVGSIGATPERCSSHSRSRDLEERVWGVSPPRSRMKDDFVDQPTIVDKQRSYYDGSYSFEPRHLADIFTIFQTAQEKWHTGNPSPPRSAVGSETDAYTTVTCNLGSQLKCWERKVDSLERECNTLKDIIKADSIVIIKLKGEIETLRSQQSSCIDENNNSQSAEQAWRHERKFLLERDKQRSGTIRILNEEISRLTKHNYLCSAAKKEVDQLRLENELLASQIIENEVEIHRLYGVIEKLERRNESVEIGITASKQSVPNSTNDTQARDESQQQLSVANKNTKTQDSFDEKLDALTARIFALENRHYQSFTRDVDKDSKMMGIEVSIDGNVVNEHQHKSRTGKITSDTKTFSWSGFCDCFQSTASE